MVNERKGNLVDFTLGFCEGIVDSGKFALGFTNPRSPNGIKTREVGYDYGLQALPMTLVVGTTAMFAYYAVSFLNR